MSSNLTLAARLTLDAQRWQQGLGRATTGMKSFTSGAKRELGLLKNAFDSVEGRLASIGVSVGATALVMQSAQMDKSLIRIQQTAGMTADQTKRLRKELFAMGAEAGTSVDELQAGFGNLVAGSLSFEKALPTIQAINKSMAVTGSEASTLSGALLSAQEHFGFDLSQANVASDLLDKMTVAGRAGVIEIEDLSGAFASSAKNAHDAGLSFEQTLGLFEALGTATTKDRLGTLVDSTLRVFTTDNYMKAAQKASGVRFFQKGKRRDPLEILADIKKQFDSKKTEEAQFKFISAAFGKADQDTIKGIKSALSDGKLEKILSITKQVEKSAGTTARDYPAAINNAVDQAGRLKNVLRAAADDFAQPINDAIASITGKLINKKADGGQELDGKQLAMLAGGGVGLAYLTKRFGGALGSKIFGRSAGIAEGKALEAAAGVMPVFVTNMPAVGLGVPGAATSAVPGVKQVAKVGAVLTAAAIGYEVGTQIYDKLLTDQGPAGSKTGQATGEAIGLYVTRQLAPISSEATNTLKEAGTATGKLNYLMGNLFPVFGMIDAHLANQKANQQVNNNITITPNKDGSYSAKTDNPKAKTVVNTGRFMPMTGKI